MLTHRLAVEADLPALQALMTRAIERLQRGFLSAEQVAASHKVMGLDSQLITDRTYFMVEQDGRIAGCGGWSFRATLYGGDDSVVARTPERLDPAHDAAKVRAMYTDPDFARLQPQDLRRVRVRSLGSAGSPLPLSLHLVHRLRSAILRAVRAPLRSG